jgi:hypothetical protein
MTGDDQPLQEELAESRPNQNYSEGFKRIWIVFTVGWVGMMLIFPVSAILQGGTNRLNQSFGISFFAVLLVPPALAYVVLLRVLPWIVEGFRNGR